MLAHLHALVATIDAQHLNTRDHSQNVAAYAAAIGERLGLSRERIVLLRRAALFHDIGKVAVRGDVLNKPSALTDEEFEEIKVHAVVGGAMLKHSGFAEEAEWVRHHHERLDGLGYPDALAGSDIPLEARIIFVADSFEAMTSDRPYQAGIPVADAIKELRSCAGTQFEPRLVEALVELLEQGELAVLALRDAA
jgi:putative nucleotidyltransferase with HDIG domain